MITVYFNGEAVSLMKNCSLTEVLNRRGYTNNCFAVAVNQHFIPNGCYQTTSLNDGDNVEIVSPMQGG